MSDTRQRIGFIGLGNMGTPMARHLIAQGYDVKVFDVSEAARAAFGPSAADTAADAATDVDVVITMLPTGKIVHDVLLGSGDALAKVAPGTIVIDTSSSDATGTVALGTALSARGLPLIDAPVSGGVVLAGEGKLALMVGTDDDAALAAVQPILNTLGARVLHLGKLGSGHAAKAINNAVAAANIAIAAEGLVLGERFGIPPEAMLDVINSSTGRSGVSETLFKTQVLTRTFSQGFALALMTKDVGLAGDLARALDLNLPQLAATEQAWIDARDTLEPGADFTAFYRHVENRNSAE